MNAASFLFWHVLGQDAAYGYAADQPELRLDTSAAGVLSTTRSASTEGG
jgi:hypothetical protein